MSNNFLKLNADKTEIPVIGTDDTRQKIISKLGSQAHQNKSKVKNLGVTLDLILIHTNNVTKIAFYHLRNIAKRSHWSGVVVFTLASSITEDWFYNYLTCF